MVVDAIQTMKGHGYSIPQTLINLCTTLVIRSLYRKLDGLDPLQVCPINFVSQCKLPCFILSANNDDYIKQYHGEKIFKEWIGPKLFEDFDGKHFGERSENLVMKTKDFILLYLNKNELEINDNTNTNNVSNNNNINNNDNNNNDNNNKINHNNSKKSSDINLIDDNDNDFTLIEYDDDDNNKEISNQENIIITNNIPIINRSSSFTLLKESLKSNFRHCKSSNSLINYPSIIQNVFYNYYFLHYYY
jgi:hypothetical protein